MSKDNGNRSDFSQFLDSVCGHVRAKQLHPEIKDELTGHLEELVEEYIAEGKTEQEAIDAAISRMGEPHLIGRELDRTHRPRTDWVMLLLILLFTGIGLLAIYNVQTYASGSLGNSQLLERKIVFTVIGIAMMCALWAIDYQRIKKYSEYFFVAGLLLMAWVSQFAWQVNGQRTWLVVGSFSFYVPTVAIFAMIVGMAGIKPLKDRNWKESLLLIAYRGIVPIYLLMEMKTATMAAIYTVIFVVYLCLTSRFWWQAAAFAAGCVLFAGFMAINSPYGFVTRRALNFLNHWDDPRGSGYVINLSLDILRSAGWWGKGGLPKIIVPFPQSEGLLPNFIYAFGWAGGVIVIMLIVGFIGKIVITSIHLKDAYGKLLVAVLGSWFIIQFIWTVAMIFGYAPFVGISLPFISYGGTEQLIQFAAIGLMLGVYRRRNRIAASRDQSEEILAN
ncbi:FtsW/RodA/SpoVE family cell cycle protein [Cohnella yongneupensis]|uniref:FtsW/RodA/SpoVE family cell cycle protein n=1 Tax=Cohnella yongneupensis TaxID=425006 RepID=A0ABW0R081_9BACL